MTRKRANLRAHHQLKDLCNDKECKAKQNVAEGPSIVEGVDDEHDLQHNVDQDHGSAKDVLNDKERHGRVWGEAGDGGECGNVYKE